MRPLRLDMAGFAVFREPTTIDFTDADFFALVGPTGSGKSTVLDAICFALYGTVPRWGDRRAITNALAPSSTEARVRLVFESAGARFVLTRVVRRDGKGTVSTKHAGLEALPAGYDLTMFDSRASLRDEATPQLGTVLAGTPAELDAAVAEVIGLPYEQFTKCVVLPQGEFAAFLHAKPAERQRILVNLLGLDVYGKIREKANAVATEAEATVAATTTILKSLSDASQEAITAASDQVARASQLVHDVERVLPELTSAQTTTAEARTTLTALDREIATLSSVTAPRDTATIAATVERAHLAVATAMETVVSAEEREEKLRSEMDASADPGALREWLRRYEEADRLTTQLEANTQQVAAEEKAQAVAEAALAAARASATSAHANLDAAREAYQVAVMTDRASALRVHLTLGQPCPVCERPVERVPQLRRGTAVTAAETAGTQARTIADAADAEVARADTSLRTCELTLARARERLESLAKRGADLRTSLADAPKPQTLHDSLAALGLLRQGVDEAAEAVRSARTAQRAAAGAARQADTRLRAAWTSFDSVRDTLATWGPPPTDRENLCGAWDTLIDWTATQVATRTKARKEAAAAVDLATKAVAAAREAIAHLLTSAGVTQPREGGDPARAAAVALERAQAAHGRAVERKKEADNVHKQQDDCRKQAQVARALASHLRSDRFERWLLTEALDSLVEAASQILRELSSGQYDLGHEKGEFFVVDHYDAGLRRAVRTLSGGETFQASLALALALSEQLAGASTAAASLESILLDEGFGTLDSSTLESVAATLENLAARGDRMVGVVTHVGGLADRIPVRFEVSRDAATARVERISL